MFKKIIIVTLFCLSLFIQAEFQQSWEQEIRDHVETNCFGKKIKGSMYEEVFKEILRRTQNSQVALENTPKMIDIIESAIKDIVAQRDRESLKIDTKNAQLLSIIKYLQKKYNLSDNVLFKKGEDSNGIGFAYYNSFCRVICLDEKFLLEKECTLGCLAFLLLHEIGHLRQHEKLGMLNFSKELRLNLKDLESDADRFAMSHFCKKCRKEVEKKVLDINYPLAIAKLELFFKKLDKMYITLGFQSAKDAMDKIPQIGKKGLVRVALKLDDRSRRKFEKLEEAMKYEKIVSYEVARPFNNYLSKEEFLKELDSVKTEECLCCKFIGQENVHTVPAEL